jgi:hypothetical protein
MIVVTYHYLSPMIVISSCYYLSLMIRVRKRLWRGTEGAVLYFSFDVMTEVRDRSSLLLVTDDQS